MSNLYESIPPEQEGAYLDRVEIETNAATEQVIHELGRITVLDAEELTQMSGQAPELADQTEADLRAGGLQGVFMEEMERARNDSIGDQAERFVNHTADAYASQDPNLRSAQKYAALRPGVPSVDPREMSEWEQSNAQRRYVETGKLQPEDTQYTRALKEAQTNQFNAARKAVGPYGQQRVQLTARDLAHPDFEVKFVPPQQRWG